MIIPPINSKGIFTFSSPVDKHVPPSLVLEVTAIRKLNELLDGGEDPLVNVYKVLDLTEEDLHHDLEHDVPVVVLMTETGKYFYVPASKINSMPNTIGFKYQETLLAFNLGVIPLDIDLDNVVKDIDDFILNRLGIKTKGIATRTSALILVNKTDDAKIRKRFESRKTVKKNYRSRYLEQKEVNDKLKDKIKKLECYIKGIACKDDK